MASPGHTQQADYLGAHQVIGTQLESKIPMLSIGTTEELGMLNISHMVLISTYFPNHQNLDSQQQDTWILLALFFFWGGGSPIPLRPGLIPSHLTLISLIQFEPKDC